MSRLSDAGASRLLRATVARVPLLAGATCALVAGTGFAAGGYFPSTWGWPTLAASWTAGLAVVGTRRVEIGRLALAAIALLAGLVAWTASSAIWSLDGGAAALEAQRASIYVAAVLAALLWAGRRPERLLHGVWAGVVLLCSWALVTRLVPDRFGVVDAISGYRLSEPIGYWNALGLLAAMGALLAVGLLARDESRVVRGLAAASLQVFALTLYFTFSRGAWIALALGLLAALAVARRRLQLLAALAGAAPWTALVVWRAAVSPALTTSGSSFDRMTHQGHRLALVAAVISIGAALTTMIVAAMEPRIGLGPRSQRMVGAAVCAAVVAGVVGGFAHYGSPPKLANRVWRDFSSESVASSGSLNNRLFQLGGNSRTALWSVAWRDAQAHPELGSGAGTFEDVWNLERDVGTKRRDAHNLYLETLAELGPPGLALLLGALALPLASAVRRRERPLALAAFGAYVAFLAHAAVDWDWEIPSVTLVALLCGASLLAGPGGALRGVGRRAALVGSVALAVVGIYTIASQLPVTKIHTAARHEDWPAAIRHAERASELAPWSAQPWITLGEAELRAGRLAQARMHFRKATTKSPSEWTPWFDLARASTGPERVLALRHASRLNPLSPEIAALRAPGT